MLGGEEDELLQQAIAMSMQVNEMAAAPAPPAPSQVPTPLELAMSALYDDGSMDEELKRALQMSVAADAQAIAVTVPSKLCVAFSPC